MAVATNAKWLLLMPGRLRARLESRPNAMKFAGNSAWLLFDKLIRLVLGLLVSAWMARYLGPSQFGELSYVLAYIAFFQVAATLGLDSIVVRDIARDPASAPQTLGTVFALRLAAGVSCWLLAIGGMVAADGWSGPLVLLTALVGAVVVFQPADTIDLWFQSQSESRRTVIAKLLAYLLSSALKIGLILAAAPLAAFAAALAFDAIGAAVGLMLAYRRFPAAGRWTAIRHRGRQLLQECWPLLLSGVLVITYMRIDQLMLKKILGERELGIYVAALSLSQMWHAIPMIVSVSLLPVATALRRRSQDEYIQLMTMVFRYHFLIAALISLLVAFASPFLIRHLFGPHYSEAAAVLRVHVFSNIFVFAGVAHSVWLTAEGRTKVRLVGTLIAGVCSVAGNFILIPELGVVGPAYVAVVSMFIAAVGINYFLAPDSFRMQLAALWLGAGPLKVRSPK